jgi:segregation and condensation protein A
MEENKEDVARQGVKQEQIQNILFDRTIGWQEIILDLINSEQLDPWDINIVILTDKYLEKIRELEEADFFISSKVLLAASLLLRIKSEFLLDRYIKNIDDVLFQRRDEKRKPFERIELEELIPELIPKSPMPRFKKVTLQELMDSLNKAIITENRRIKKVIMDKNALRESSISMPKHDKISISDKIKEVFDKLTSHFKKEKDSEKVKYTHLFGENKEERIACFYPALQLENNNQIWLEQLEHFDEIHLWLKDVYIKKNGNPYKGLNADVVIEDDGLDPEIFEAEEEEKK